VLSAVAEMVTSQPELQESVNVKKVQQIAQQYLVSGTATTAGNELKIYNRTNTAAGSKFVTAIGR
jgi:hypothetical protein